VWYVIGLVVVLAIIGFVVVGMYNGLVGLRNKIENAFAQIDVQLKRRHDLIPNLVETVKGYATHEKETFERVIAARNAAVNATGPAAQAGAENVLTGALKSLIAVAEAYPELRASEQFADLQRQLAETEDRIAYSRGYYNDIVRTYNTKVETFPSSIVANAFKFSKRQYFEADETSRANVEVKFD
jgi:LemA protein